MTKRKATRDLEQTLPTASESEPHGGASDLAPAKAPPSPQWLDEVPSEAGTSNKERARRAAAPRVRASKKSPIGDHEVGYCRPPAHSRFQPGNRANPRGRPRGSKNVMTLIAEKLAEKHPVSINGRPAMMSKREMGATRFVNRFAETGDPKYAAMILRHEDNEALARVRGGPNPEDSSEPTLSDADVLAWFRDKVAQDVLAFPAGSLPSEDDAEDVP